MEGGGRDGDITRDTKRRCRVNSIWPQKGPLRNRCLVRYGGTSFGCSLSAPSRFSVAVPLRRAKSGPRLTHRRDEQGLPSFVLARAERRRGACSMQIRVEGDRATNGLESSSLRFSDSTRLVPAWQSEGCEPNDDDEDSAKKSRPQKKLS